MCSLDIFEKIPTSSEWFEVYRLPNNVFAISEPYHEEEVISYLIVGQEKSLLLDTGMGVDNIRNIVDDLATNKIVVINSHVHFDHVGNNHLFDEALVFDDAESIKNLKNGYTADDLKRFAEKSMFTKNPPAGFDFNNYCIRPCHIKPVQNGDIIDLGDRKIEVIHTPGHSKDSIMLLDKENRILFTGDSFYLGPLFVYFNGGIFGYSDLNEYFESMKKVSELVPDLDYIHPSHNDVIVKPAVL
ncbi:MAG: MBL fold metallo-hydrolase, partial [Clostridia bacterium]|nr:MBL fold metallo-hydrolase [Clostridia bacterium]